jgi:hypothetical protein
MTNRIIGDDMTGELAQSGQRGATRQPIVGVSQPSVTSISSIGPLTCRVYQADERYGLMAVGQLIQSLGLNHI